MELRLKKRHRQDGISLVGFIFVVAIIALIAIVGVKVVPTVIEYSAIKKAIVAAKSAGSTAQEIKASFDRQREVGYIESVAGDDLEIARSATGVDVSVAYQKKIGLFGPVSLVIDYMASTADTSGKKIE
jgi:Tfp pilus assembly major pilin PilA